MRFSRFMVAITMLLLVGCGGGDGGTTSEPATLEDAWSEFEAGRYASAVSVFHEVLDNDPALNDANNGLGWSFAFGGQLDSAQGYFANAIAASAKSVNATLTDAKAGLSAVALALDSESDAISNATSVLDDEPDWEFEHANDVDYEDLRLILAQAYFAQGESSYPLVQAQLDVLDPANGLDSADSNTWNGQSTYAAALLLAIQKVEESVGSDMLL